MNMLIFSRGFEIFGISIKYYGIIVALGMCAGVIVACYNAKLRNLKSEDIYTLALYVLPLAIIGARLYYVIFSEHSYTFLEIFEIWKGGMAIYGGIIGGAIGVALFCTIHKKNFLELADVASVSLILGQCIGRWANFVNQEAFGYEVTNTAWQWFPFAVKIEALNEWHLATFFYESMCSLIIFVVLMILIRKIKQKGFIMSLYFIGYGLARMFVEGLRTDSLYIGSSGIRVSQLLSGLLVIFGIIMSVIIYTKHRKSVNNEKNSHIENNSIH